MVVRDDGGTAVFVQFEQIKFACRAHRDGVARLTGAAAGLAEQVAAVSLKGCAVRVADIAIEPHDAPLRGPPGQDGQRRGVGEQQQVGVVDIEKSAQRGCIEVDAVFKSARQLGRHDGNVFLIAEDVAKGQTDELDVVLLYKLYDFVHGGIHKSRAPL